MRIFVRHDKDGNIVSTTKANVLAEGLEHPYGSLEEGENVLEVQPTPELEELAPHEISERYVVAVKDKRLKRKDADPPRRARRG